MKKIFIIYLSIFTIIILSGCFKNDQNQTLSNSGACAKEGEKLTGLDMTTGKLSSGGKFCCEGLKKINPKTNDKMIEQDICIEPTGNIGTCQPCGDGICNNNYEDKCNCPEDCKNSICGKEGETIGGNIDRCCPGLVSKPLSEFGGMFACAKDFTQTSEKCGIENCHGLNVTCGPNIPKVCDKMYATGDNCIKLVSCKSTNGKCELEKSAKFDNCKFCVEKCGLDFKGNPAKSFECAKDCDK